MGHCDVKSLLYYYLLQFSHGEMFEVVVVDSELKVDWRIILGEFWAGHVEEVEADDHGVVEPDSALLRPAAHRETPQGGEARHGDGEGPRVEPLLTQSDLTLIDTAF